MGSVHFRSVRCPDSVSISTRRKCIEMHWSPEKVSIIRRPFKGSHTNRARLYVHFIMAQMSGLGHSVLPSDLIEQ